MVQPLRLTIELVPASSWYSNMRKFMTREQWDMVRRQCYREWNYRCGICGAKGRINCHEQWEYDDEKQIQTLVGFIALCDLCHHCKHMGLAQILARQGKLDFKAVISHFCHVNGCTKEDFQHISDEAFAQWSARSTHGWAIDLGPHAEMVDKEALPNNPDVLPVRATG